MTNLVSLPTRFGDPQAAKRLHELADMVESGEISNAVFVFMRLDEYVFESIGIFDDRWRILGALEYAKNSVNTQP